MLDVKLVPTTVIDSFTMTRLGEISSQYHRFLIKKCEVSGSYILEYTVVILVSYVEIGFHGNGSSNSSV